MVDSIWPESNGDHAPLPIPSVVVARSGTPMHELSAAAVKGPDLYGRRAISSAG
jgi:hypothetical protein